MAFNDIEKKRCQIIVSSYIKRIRPDISIRSQLDISFRIEKQSVEIFEIRPHFKELKQKMEISIAKATFVRNKKLWKIYWQRSDLKWHIYPPCPVVKSVEEFIDVIEQDEHACFWG